MNVLVVNAGSRTIKLCLIDDADVVMTGCDIDPWDFDGDGDAVEAFLANGDRADAVGHRVVQGGADLVEAVLTTPTSRRPERSSHPLHHCSASTTAEPVEA